MNQGFKEVLEALLFGISRFFPYKFEIRREYECFDHLQVSLRGKWGTYAKALAIRSLGIARAMKDNTVEYIKPHFHLFNQSNRFQIEVITYDALVKIIHELAIQEGINLEPIQLIRKR